MHKYKNGDKIIMMESKGSAKTGDVGIITYLDVDGVHRIKFESGQSVWLKEERYRPYSDVPKNAELF